MPEIKTPDADAVLQNHQTEGDAEVAEARKAFDAEEGDSDKAGRKHGRSFIYLTLEDAEQAARKIDEHERRMSKKSFAQALGHGDAVGRFKHKLSALEYYDLVKPDGNDVRLTELAVQMLYGGNEQVRAQARAKAFLSYDLFKLTFVECPKNQDHQMSYVQDFVRVTLKIVNEGETFLKRFLESAAYAGLLDGEPSTKATMIRLRPAVAAPTGETPAGTKAKAPEDQWVIVAPNEIKPLLDGFGLASYQDGCDVSQRSAGEVAINMADGKITVEIRRPVKVTIKTTNMLADVTEILKALQSKGFKA